MPPPPSDAAPEPGTPWGRLDDRHVDAYLIWAGLTGFEGCRPKDGVQPPGAMEEIVVALELTGSLQPALAGVRPRTIVTAGATRYATARVALADLPALLADPAVGRLELGTVEPVPPPPATPGAPEAPSRLAGRVMAVIDFGCAFAHERFRRRHGAEWRTRIAYLWDQDSRRSPAGPTWQPAHGFGYGRELVASRIDRLLNAHADIDEERLYREADYPDVARPLAHGTHVLDLAAGGDPDAGAETAAAQIIFVQLPSFAVDDTSGGSMVPYLMDALGYIRERVEPGARVVVNLSYGSMAGPHDGSTLCELAMDAFIRQAGRRGTRNVLDIVLPAGNNFAAEGHARVRLDASQPSVALPWLVLAEDPTDSFLEVWYDRKAAGALKVTVRAPDGPALVAPVDTVEVRRNGRGDCVAALIHRRFVAGGLRDAMALVALAPTASDGSRSPAPPGVWTVELSLDAGHGTTDAVEVFLWIERDDPSLGSLRGPRQSRFLTDRPPAAWSPATPSGGPFPQAMNGNSLANGDLTTVVGGYVQAERVRAPYSSVGPTRNPARVKWPNRTAPSDTSSVLRGQPAAGTRSGIVVRMDGTSVAAPVVARRLL